MTCMSFQFVNVAIPVVSPIITQRREYLGILLKSLPTHSQKNWYIENTSTIPCRPKNLTDIYKRSLLGLYLSVKGMSVNGELGLYLYSQDSSNNSKSCGTNIYSAKFKYTILINIAVGKMLLVSLPSCSIKLYFDGPVG